MGWLDSLGSSLLDIGSKVAPSLASKYGGPLAGMAAEAALNAVKSGSVQSALPDVVRMAAAAAPMAAPQISPELLSQLSALLPQLTQGSLPGLGAIVPNLSGLAAPALGGLDLGALLAAATGRR